MDHVKLLFVVAVLLLSHVFLFVTPRTAACQASLSITISQSLHKFMSIEWVMLFNHLILCHPLLLLPSIFPSIRVFSSESALHIRWPKYWSFSFSISPSSKHSGLISLKEINPEFLGSHGLVQGLSASTLLTLGVDSCGRLPCGMAASPASTHQKPAALPKLWQPQMSSDTSSCPPGEGSKDCSWLKPTILIQ